MIQVLLFYWPNIYHVIIHLLLACPEKDLEQLSFPRASSKWITSSTLSISAAKQLSPLETGLTNTTNNAPLSPCNRFFSSHWAKMVFIIQNLPKQFLSNGKKDIFWVFNFQKSETFSERSQAASFSFSGVEASTGQRKESWWQE